MIINLDPVLLADRWDFPLFRSEVIYPAGKADFRQRSQGLPSLSSAGEDDVSPVLPDRNFFAPYKIHYTMKSVTAAHVCLEIATAPVKSDEIINADLSRRASTDLLRRCGCFLHARIFYALRLLLSVAHEVWRTKKYEALDVNTLKIDAYIVALRAGLEAASEKGRYRVPSLWLNALQAKIEPWWQALRRLLAQDGHNLATASTNESPISPSKPASPLQKANGTPVDCQQPSTDFCSNVNSWDVPLSPFLVDDTYELFAFDPSFNDLLDGATTDFEAGTLPPTAPKRAPTSNEPHRKHVNIAPEGPGSDPSGESTGGNGRLVEDLDCGLLTGSEFLFSPLPSYVLNNEVSEVVGFKEERNDCRNSS